MSVFMVNDLIQHRKFGLCVLAEAESFCKGEYWTLRQLATGKTLINRHRSNFRLIGRNFKAK